MKKLLVVIHSLSGGGAERVVTSLLSYLHAQRPELQLSLALLKPNLDYEVPQGVELHILGGAHRTLPGKVLAQFGVYRRLKELVRTSQPDVVLSFMPTANVYSLLAKASLGGKQRVVVSERVAFNANYKGLKRSVLKWLFRRYYPSASGIVCVAEGVKRELMDLGLDEALCKVIPNSVDEGELLRKANERSPHAWANEVHEIPLIVNVGRLTEQKGQDVLVRAASALRDRGVPFRLMIFGTGELREPLEALISELQLTDRVQLMGFTPNPYPELSRASVFVFPSRWEGFPNALLEAMTLGVPAVAADCPYGPRELIEADQFGKLVKVDDVAMLADALEETLLAIRRPGEEARLKSQSHAGAARFSVERMLSSYVNVLSN